MQNNLFDREHTIWYKLAISSERLMENMQIIQISALMMIIYLGITPPTYFIYDFCHFTTYNFRLLDYIPVSDLFEFPAGERGERYK